MHTKKYQKMYGMESITTEEVMDNLDIFESIFWKIDKFGWWYLEKNSADAGMQLTANVVHTYGHTNTTTLT